MIELVYDRNPNGRSPFTDWLQSLRDGIAKIRIAARIRQLEEETWVTQSPSAKE